MRIQQITKLRRCDRDHPIDRRWPDKPAPLKPLAKQASPLAIVPDDLHQIAAPSAKDKQMTAQRITQQNLLYRQGKTGKTLAHIRMTRRQPNPNATRHRDHRSSITDKRRPRTAASKSGPSTIRRPPWQITSIRGLNALATAAGSGRSKTAGPITTGAKADVRSPSKRRRQLKIKLAFKP
jgi:hypothetical protein